MKNNKKKVYAHLLTWFQTKDVSGKWEMWQSDYKNSLHDPNQMIDKTHHDIAATTYPLTGPYDTNDKDIIEYQLLQMKMAGIDGVIVDWDTREINTYRHEGFMSILKYLKKFDMKLIVCFEEWAGYWPIGKIKDRDKQIDKVVSELTWLKENVIDQSDYETIDHHFPILVFRKIYTHWFNDKEWQTIKDRVKHLNMHFLFNDVYDESFKEVSDGYFTWVSGFDDETNKNTLDFYEKQFRHYMQKFEERKNKLFFGSVMPGFDDSPVNGWGDGARLAPRYDGKRYQQAWQFMKDYDVDFVQIVTWNDWNEGSQIEPCETYGYKYLKQTIKEVSSFKGTKDLSSMYIDLPLQLYHLRKDQRYNQKPLDLLSQLIANKNYDGAINLMKKIKGEK